jgi:hypothetical protein
MTMDWVDLLTGAGILTAGYLTGLLTGWRNKRPPRPPKEICQCEHPASMHDKDGCRALVEAEIKWDTYGDPSKWETRPCACVRYVGPHSSYVPELEG